MYPHSPDSPPAMFFSVLIAIKPKLIDIAASLCGFDLVDAALQSLHVPSRSRSKNYPWLGFSAINHGEAPQV